LSATGGGRLPAPLGVIEINFGATWITGAADAATVSAAVAALVTRCL
jgi:hypothetical protein